MLTPETGFYDCGTKAPAQKDPQHLREGDQQGVRQEVKKSALECLRLHFDFLASLLSLFSSAFIRFSFDTLSVLLVLLTLRFVRLLVLLLCLFNGYGLDSGTLFSHDVDETVMNAEMIGPTSHGSGFYLILSILSHQLCSISTLLAPSRIRLAHV
jgi:hypothetical protein